MSASPSLAALRIATKFCQFARKNWNHDAALYDIMIAAGIVDQELSDTLDAMTRVTNLCDTIVQTRPEFNSLADWVIPNVRVEIKQLTPAVAATP